MSASEDEYKQRAIAEHLFSQMRWMHLLALVPVFVITLMLWDFASHRLILSWAGFMVFMEMALTVVAQVSLSFHTRRSPAYWLRLYTLLHVTVSLGWTALLFLFYDSLSSWQLAAISIILLAIAVGGLNTLSWHWPTYSLGNLCLLVPVGGLLTTIPEDFLLRALGVTAFLLLPIAGISSRREYAQRLRLVTAEVDRTQLTSDLQQRSKELSRVRNALKTLKDTDSLTGLMSGERWKSEFAEKYGSQTDAGRVAVFFVDIRHFRKINQRWGTAAGDRVILEVAGHLATFIDHHNICHLSADEFAFSAPVRDEAAAIELAQSLARYLRLPIQLAQEGVSVHPEPAIGIALSPDHGQDIEVLIDYAALANHHCKGKHSHLSYAVFSDELANVTRRHIDLEIGLKQAIARNELEVLYQPQVQLDTGRIIGAEALLRWHSASLGSVSPAEFIPVAESSGLILQIGDWVLEQACSALARWQQQFGDQVHLAVNVSAVQLTTIDFADRLARHIGRWGCNSRGLHIEITESAIMEHPELAMRVLKKLRLLGVGVALDDFGTGYSSLSYLKDMEIDYLKLDRSFISNINASPKDRAITESVIHMAQAIGLRLVAEGIETEEIGGALCGMGCDYGQGWLYGRPMKEAALTGMIADPAGHGVVTYGASARNNG